jgi:hypothetical protein
MTGILVVRGLKRERGVHQIQIDGVQPASVQAGLQRRLDPFGPVIVVPQLCGHKQVLAAHGPVDEQLFKGHADVRFVTVSLGSVEMAEAHLDCCLDGISGFPVIGEAVIAPTTCSASWALEW